MYITVLDYTWGKVCLFDLTQVTINHDTFDYEEFLDKQGFDINNCYYMVSNEYPLEQEVIYKL